MSLRGIGPSGVSRSLVLIDGVPFNDPFGGWVYWTRVPLENVDRIELVDGTSSSVYGNYAMGGVINFMSARPRPRTLELRTQYGNKNSPKADFVASDVWGKVGVSFEGSGFTTDGFPQVIANERGRVDTLATVDYSNFALKVDYSPAPRVSVFGRAGYFREERDNAKITTIGPPTPEANDTKWKSVNGGVRATLPDTSDLQARIFFDNETFHSNFMAVAAGPPPASTPRFVGRMTLLQEVPDRRRRADGAVVQGDRLAAHRVGRRRLAARGRRQPGTGPRCADRHHRDAAARRGRHAERQRRVRAGPDVAEPSSSRSRSAAAWTTGATTTAATSRPTFPPARRRATSRTLPDREDTVFSPRAAVLYRVNDKVSAWGSIGSGFRAPTLNELYRQFRVGAILTLANHELGPERLVGGELGLNIAPVENLSVRTTWFDNRMKNPVSNVTIATNTQQRQNLGRTRIWGIQTDAEYRFGAVLARRRRATSTTRPR